MIPPLPTTYFAVFDHDLSSILVAEETVIGHSDRCIIKAMIEDDFISVPIAIYRVKEGEPTTNVSKEIAEELIWHRDAQGFHLPEMALDFCESHGVKARPFVFKEG